MRTNGKQAEELIYAAEAQWIKLDHPEDAFPFRSYAVRVDSYGPSEDECFRLRAYNKEGRLVSTLLTAISATEMEKHVGIPSL